VVVNKESRGNFEVLHLLRDVTGRRRTEEFVRKAGTALRQLLDEGNGREEEPALPPLPRLSKRESEVLHLLAVGLSTQQIAETIDVRPVTARNHIARLLTKLGVESRLQAVVYASRHRLI
jgi:DNA-binding NarL/FixJ family response regulator